MADNRLEGYIPVYKLMRVTIQDVAERAGMSPKTVSVGLSGSVGQKITVSVFRHVSVVGFDSPATSAVSTLSLTSVNQPVERFAFDATSHHLTPIRSEERGESTLLAKSAFYD